MRIRLALATAAMMVPTAAFAHPGDLAEFGFVAGLMHPLTGADHLAAALLVGGLAITFYFPHRRVRGIVSTTTGGSSARLAPIARRDWSAKRVFERLALEIGRQLETSPELHVNEPASASPGSRQSVRSSL